MFRYPEGFGDMLSERKPYKGIGRNRRNFLFGDCRDIVERICRIVSLVRNLSVVRRRFAQCTLAGSFNDFLKVLWHTSMGNFKSIPVIFSHNLLYLLVLQQFAFKLTGQ
jgi:hypothetical protein